MTKKTKIVIVPPKQSLVEQSAKALPKTKDSKNARILAEGSTRAKQKTPKRKD